MKNTSPVLTLIEKCRELQQVHHEKKRDYELQLEIPNWRDNGRTILSDEHDSQRSAERTV